MTEILKIFPTPIYCANKIEFSKTEIDFFLNSKKDKKANEGNTTNADYNILDNPLMVSLKNKLNHELQNYYNIIEQPKNLLKPYITQSWLNFTEKNQYHHRHRHDNSLVSGVLYVQTTDENDCIFFYKDEQHVTTDFMKFKNNEFNSKEIKVQIQTGNLLLFPSKLDHSVPKKTTSGVRISLSFNSFVKGNIGDNEKLTGLILK